MTGDTHETSFLFQSLSAMIHCFNAVDFQSTISMLSETNKQRPWSQGKSNRNDDNE